MNLTLISLTGAWSGRWQLPLAKDQQTQDGTLYMCSDYIHKVTSIIFAHRGNAHHIACTKDLYDETHFQEMARRNAVCM